MSEQRDEQTSGEGGSVGCGSTASIASDPLIDSVMASVREASAVQPPQIAPNQEAPPKADPPEPPKADPSMDALKVLASTLEAAQVEPLREETGKTFAASTAQAAPRKRRFGAMAAVVALATVAGAVGGALATAGFSHVADAAATTSGDSALESAIARIDADIVALKAGLEQTSKIGMSQFNKTSDRLDKVEKAQTEPTTKLAKLSEAIDKLRAAQAAVPAAPPAVAAASPAPAVAAASAAPRDVTGSMTTPPGTAALPPPAASPGAPPKTAAARLPRVEGWVLREVARGGALIEGRNGLYEVYAGDPVPGLGRVDSIRKQDGRWVVVTTRGLIVSR